MDKQKIAVLGAGSWGTALGILLAQKGYQVDIWGNEPEVLEEINTKHTNNKYLPELKISEGIKGNSNLQATIAGSLGVVLAIPAQTLRQVLRQVQPYLTPDQFLVNTAKGIENKSLLRLSEVIREEVGEVYQDRVAILSGPSHAEEVARGIPTTIVVAAHELKQAEEIQDIFMTDNFRVYINMDMIGVEISGAMKNIIALSSGAIDGLGLGDNTKAAIITRGLAEISRLGESLGGRRETFSGLAGIGDLVVTCTSSHSRNWKAGMLLGKGKDLPQVLQEVGMVVEGITTTEAAYQLAKKMKVEMPITEQVYKVVYEGKNPKQVIYDLMRRDKKHEIERDLLNF